ncbi:alternative ribosome rescue aminoacyl-tRNA hydrolase ArfB [Rhizosaccharibacter radicis]|uniref:Aminoacyl-tRNA hydrolase n=1 Tax=Rhizosaccharibacter radicis TaxID=2782605 RepID=A0ABT1VZH5_9PROT|nr:aminoacyl-tRNA hydrolase [Acetobacteraceae bacterium KSS12]
MPGRRIEIAPGVALNEDELSFTYILASGPGGQNVNKVATAAQMRFDLRGSPSLPDRVRARAEMLAGSRLSRDGVLVMTARRFRSQERNREDAIERLVELLREASHRQARRIPTRPSFGERQRRLEGKAKRGDIKKNRSFRHED